MVPSFVSFMWITFIFITDTVQSATDRTASQTLTSKTEQWGSWSNWIYCDENQWANTITFRSERNLGDSGDDVAGVAVRLICQIPGSATEYLYDMEPTLAGKEWGKWYNMTDGKTLVPGRACALGHWLKGFRTNVEDKCGTVCVDDETALNCIEMKCSDDSTLIPTDCREFGTWGNWDQCDQGYICGFREKFLADGIRVDEKGLNGVEFQCCDFITINPSNSPSLYPSFVPSNAPSLYPTDVPSIAPSLYPTFIPSIAPSLYPTDIPSISPSFPTSAPSIASSFPTFVPSFQTILPSLYPTDIPVPSNVPSLYPTDVSVSPTEVPNIRNSFYNILDSKTLLTIVWVCSGVLCCIVVVGWPLAVLRKNQKEKDRSASDIVPQRTKSDSDGVINDDKKDEEIIELVEQKREETELSLHLSECSPEDKTKDIDKVGKCTDCASIKSCKIYNGLLYCDLCWSLYIDDESDDKSAEGMYIVAIAPEKRDTAGGDGGGSWGECVTCGEQKFGAMHVGSFYCVTHSDMN